MVKWHVILFGNPSCINVLQFSIQNGVVRNEKGSTLGSLKLFFVRGESTLHC